MEADAYNARELAFDRVRASDLTGLTRCAQRYLGLVVDGKFGPQTQASIELNERPGHASSEPSDQADAEELREWDGPLGPIPRTRREILEVFGDPGTVRKPHRSWRWKNIVTVRDLPGVPYKWHFKCHRLAEPYLREGLRRARQRSSYEIERAAGWVLRHVRHDPDRPLSLHSWGIAVDFDREHNSPKRFARGTCPAPFSAQWDEWWPPGPHRVDRNFVLALESVGFTWGGVWGRSGDDLAQRAARTTFADPMHFELRLR